MGAWKFTPPAIPALSISSDWNWNGGRVSAQISGVAEELRRARFGIHARIYGGVRRLTLEETMEDLKKLIREIPDHPKPGILFYDLTTLLQDPRGFHSLVDQLCSHYNGKKVDIVAGIEARGFIFAPALAYRLGAGFIPVRKPKEAAMENRVRDVSARIRQRHARNSPGRGEAWSARPLV